MDFFAIQVAARRKARSFRILSIPFLLASAPVALLTVSILLSFVTLFMHVLLDSTLHIELHSRTGGLAPLYPWVALWPQSRLKVTDTFQVVWGLIDVVAMLSLTGFIFFNLIRGRRHAAPGVLVGELKASELLIHDADIEERQLLNIVEEMSVAGRMATPRVYAWEAGGGVNAMARGDGINVTEIYVSHAALVHLNREETQALVAHEMSRVMLEHEIPKLRTFGTALMNFGALRLATWMVRFPRRPELTKDAPFWDYSWVWFLQWTFYLAYLPFGLALWFGGSLQFLIGRLFTSVMQRWAIGNADLLALQYTRNPVSIKSLLMKAAVHGGSVRGDAKNEDLENSCFAPISRSRWFDTHPSIDKRLRAIDSRYNPAELADFRDREASRGKLLALERSDFESRRIAKAQRKARLDDAVRRTLGDASTGIELSRESADFDSSTLAPPVLPLPTARTHNPADDVRARVLALLLAESPARRNIQLDALSIEAGDRLALAIRRKVGEPRACSPEDRAAALDDLLPAVDELPQAQARALLAYVGILQPLNADLEVFEYALGRVVIQRLRNRSGSPRSSDRTLAGEREAVESSLAVLAEKGHATEADAAAAYSGGAVHALGTGHNAYQAVRPWVPMLNRALHALDGLQAADKRILLEAMEKVIRHDGRESPEETALVRVMAVSLNVEGCIGKTTGELA